MNPILLNFVLVLIIAILVTASMIYFGLNYFKKILNEDKPRPSQRETDDYEDLDEEIKSQQERIKEWRDLGPQANWDNDPHWEPETFTEWEKRNFTKSGKRRNQTEKPKGIPHGSAMVLFFGFLSALLIGSCIRQVDKPDVDIRIKAVGIIYEMDAYNKTILFDSPQYSGRLELSDISYVKTLAEWKLNPKAKYSFDIPYKAFKDEAQLDSVLSPEQKLTLDKRNIMKGFNIFLGIAAIFTTFIFLGFLEDWGKTRKEVYKK